MVVPPAAFYQKIEQAAHHIGIDNLVIREWNRNMIRSGFTDGVVREQRYDRRAIQYEQQQNKDLGYIRKHKKELTVDAFKINPDVFSNERFQDFRKALEKQGLDAYAYHPFGLVFAPEHEIARPEPLYK